MHYYHGIKLEAVILGMETQHQQSRSLQRLNAITVTILCKLPQKVKVVPINIKLDSF